MTKVFVSNRYLLVLTMMHEIHYKLMSRVREKREGMQASEMQVCPRSKKFLEIAIKSSGEWKASWNGSSIYLVKNRTKAVTVYLEKKTCDCRVFDLKGIPCCHAIALYMTKGNNILNIYRNVIKETSTYNHTVILLKLIKERSIGKKHNLNLFCHPKFLRS